MDNKRVNIQYSVNMGEIPGVVTNFIEDISDYLSAAWSEEYSVTEPVVEAISQENYNKAIEGIKKIRMQLANIDYRLEDSMSILSGYQAYLLKKDSSPPPVLQPVQEQEQEQEEEVPEDEQV